jgi:hypothetical protein
MVLALKNAKMAGLGVSKEPFEGALKWFDSCTDPKTGRVGYKKFSGPKKHAANSMKVPGENPTMTAISVICSIFCKRERKHQNIKKGVEILMKNLPQRDKTGMKVDAMYWYFGTRAMFQHGGKNWHKWNTAMKNVLLKTQRRDGCALGSWDPEGACWGISGGRVMSTALSVMTLQLYRAYRRASAMSETRELWLSTQ